ncbi:Na+/H+ antiporter NhaC family protein [Treponema ruminis]|uniref:Na+/H+ antiporter NhaC n=1 Tax=Treponema ruminis TaxID=744515 RepID=A0A7W8G9B8_9SPIR|nr:Na+/H+ antiporter NhaC family protein [Treponema ruminis]MBB5226258.1 Na+/H+ antiporter NhaC [Treponema ruminis]QSI02834.1 Na+/H+ antiporter NhaC family protein [Treponema ruminis]
MTGTFFSLVPPIVAIALALITKEVYSSLFIGILIGGAFFAIDAGSGFTGFFTHVFSDGMIKQLSSAWNVGILVFLVVLGTMVALMNNAGGSAAFGEWAKKHIKSKLGAQLATVCLGVLIFIDDYFNCLTVGSVMRPITKKYKVSREKLAYLIDATAAPVCIIAPISSWAAAVAGFVSEGENGLALFCKAIPFNFYAFFTIGMMFLLICMNFEFGAMAKFENSRNDMIDDTDEEVTTRGKVFDLVFPIVSLIVLCTVGMIYTGGFFASGEDHKNFVDAFANSDASVGLVLGSFAALILTIVLYQIRRVLSFKDCMACIPNGFKAMVPAILILTLAWTLKAMTDSLDASKYVAGLVEGSAKGLQNFLPAIIFVIAGFLAFATGTSWGTFGILIPICIAVFPGSGDPLRIISISACMAGAVAGDHCSPISDTTIMASAGAQCEHVSHVSTQLPYALTVAGVSFLTYIVAGFTQSLGIFASGIISWIVGAVLLVGTMIVLKKKFSK